MTRLNQFHRILRANPGAPATYTTAEQGSTCMKRDFKVPPRELLADDAGEPLRLRDQIHIAIATVFALSAWAVLCWVLS